MVAADWSEWCLDTLQQHPSGWYAEPPFASGSIKYPLMSHDDVIVTSPLTIMSSSFASLFSSVCFSSLLLLMASTTLLVSSSSSLFLLSWASQAIDGFRREPLGSLLSPSDPSLLPRLPQRESLRQQYRLATSAALHRAETWSECRYGKHPRERGRGSIRWRHDDVMMTIPMQETQRVRLRRFPIRVSDRCGTCRSVAESKNRF